MLRIIFSDSIIGLALDITLDSGFSQATCANVQTKALQAIILMPFDGEVLCMMDRKQ